MLRTVKWPDCNHRGQIFSLINSLGYNFSLKQQRILTPSWRVRDVNHEPFQSVRIFDTVEYLDFEKCKCTEKTWKIWHVELLIFQKISFGTFGHEPIKSRVYFLVAILNSLHLNIVQRNSQRILPTYVIFTYLFEDMPAFIIMESRL